MNILTRKTARLAGAFVLLFGAAWGISQALPAYGQTSGGHPFCVKYGPAGVLNSTGNTVLNDWNDSACQPGTYPLSVGGGTTVIESAPRNFEVNANNPANDTTWTVTDFETGQVFTCRYVISDVASPGMSSPLTTSCTRSS